MKWSGGVMKEFQLLTLGGICALILFWAELAAQLHAEDIPATLTLPIALDLANAQHPEIRAANAKAKGSEGLVRQAGLKPNPSITFQSENWRFSGNPSFVPAQDLDLFAFVTQPVELGGKRQHRIDLSRKESAQFLLERKLTSWRIHQQVKQSFWKALAAQKELDLTQSIQADFQSVLEYHQNRFAQGAIAEADLIKVQLEGERLEFSLENARLSAEQARLELLRSMAIQTHQTNFKLEPPETRLLPHEGFSRSALLERALQIRGEIQMARLQLEQSEADLELQKANVFPDLDAILGYKRTTGYNTLLAGISIPVPFFNRNQGNLLRVEHDRTAQQEKLRTISLQTENELNLALAGLQRRYRMLRQLQKGMLDRAEESWKIAMAAYREGGLDLLRLLDAQRSRNDIQLMNNRTQIEFQLNLVELEYAVGEENLPIGENTLGEMFK
jgi:outer membrane protein, heavy metal efflux system